MNVKYSLSAIMKQGHKIAKSLGLDTYKEALSRGLRKSWAIAKGLLPNMMVEEAVVVHEDIQQEWAYSCMSAKEVEVCAFEVAQG